MGDEQLQKAYTWIESYSDGGEMCLECGKSYSEGDSGGHICMILDSDRYDIGDCPALPDDLLPEPQPHRKL